MNIRNHLKATNYWWAMATSASNVQRFFLQVSFSSFQIKLGFKTKTYFNLQWVCLVTTIASTSKGTWPTLASLACTRTKCKLRTFPNNVHLKMFRCLSCEETFYDRDTLLSHLGVKHNMINEVLKEKGFSRIPLEQVKPISVHYFLSIDPRRHR